MQQQSWVEQSTRLTSLGASAVEYRETQIPVDNVSKVDSAFFEVFSFSFIQGAPEKALTRPNTAVISSEMATRLFKDDLVMGQTIRLEGSDDDLK